ncbi:MAG: hypothetical protein FWC43_08695 [Planctomycetaceae bacterium]|nr:hypothetical protein [Planctomycetaceae bacterium]MCL2305273.1 hypothetical protein [Planctomycetaceae bacterium]MCL2305406.1 hypothetical protein [Planctomycetaceae bacterium]
MISDKVISVFITYHLSLITYHLSLITYHLSLITYHLFSIMKKQSSIFLFVVFSIFLAILGNRFLVPFGQLRAQQSTVSSTEELLDRRVETFFRDLEQAGTLAKTTAVFEEIFQEDSSTPRTSTSAVDNMSTRFMELSSSEIGQLHGCEKIGAKPVGRDVILLKYLTKHDKAPVSWVFTFYRSPRSNSTWNLILVRFDTNLESAM